MNKNKHLWSHFLFGLVLITGSLFNNTVGYAAEKPLPQRPEVQAFIQDMVKTYHFKKQDLVQLFSEVQVQPKIIESMTRPYEAKPWDVYKQIFLTPSRVQEGLSFWKQNQETLKLAQQKYGVPPHIIVAILGVETRYGLKQGDYRVIDALSTLAFNYPPRAPFFQKELREYLLLCREHQVKPTAYYGSYAGAMGKPQFMPSSYRYYADDFKGATKKDLMHDDAAAIASIANYFKHHGWKDSQAVTQQAQIKGRQYASINTRLKTAEYPLTTLIHAGVRPVAPLGHVPHRAGLIHLTTQTGSEFWLAYPNFYVITRYNQSPQYAMVVYLLSEQIKEAWQKNA